MKKMKMKMKGVVAKESSPYVVGEDPRTRLRHQSLLLDFEELQKVSSFVGFQGFVISFVVSTDLMFCLIFWRFSVFFFFWFYGSL